MDRLITISPTDSAFDPGRARRIRSTCVNTLACSCYGAVFRITPPRRTLMDELQRLINVYSSRGSSSVKSRLDVLMDLERVRDPRVVPSYYRCWGTRMRAKTCAFMW